MGEITPREPERALEGPKGPEVRVPLEHAMYPAETHGLMHGLGVGIKAEGEK